MRNRQASPSSDGYERPQQLWQCGLADEGPACPLGPSAGGHCPAAAACHPVRDGDRWHCNRSPLRGGPCPEGPGHDGACAIVYRCTPMRSLRSRRGRFVAGVAIAAVGAVAMGLSGSWRNDFIAPGPLTVHHAQLLDASSESLRCAQCHAAGGANLGQWWGRSTGGDSLGESQSMLCMECHKKSIDVKLATAAHNWGEFGSESAGGGDASDRSDRLRDPATAITCSTCHREHLGTHHDLKAMTDNACQACHREHFASFADGHPEFTDWPYERRTRHAFDHASHQLKHFPTEKQEFACAACHQADATNGQQLTFGYEVACASCHDKSIVASLADGVPLVALPTLDVDALADAGRNVMPWPTMATGDLEGSPPMPARLLIAMDPQGAAALTKLGPTFDFFDVNPDDTEQLAAAADGAMALKSLANDLADRGQAAIAERLKGLLDREMTAVELQALAGRLSPDVARAYRDRWFNDAPTDEAASEDREALRDRIVAGGWLRDDLTLSLRYQPIGHADPLLRAWFDVLAEAASSAKAETAVVAKPLLEMALKPTAAGQCGSCHFVESNKSGRLVIQWQASSPKAESPGFTRFSHAPHILQPAISDCTSCHRIETSDQSTASADEAPRKIRREFAAITRASCAQCHTPHAAGDSCTQCHKYHAGQTPQLNGSLLKLVP